MTITVYSKQQCVQCKQTTKQLDKLGADYVVLDATENVDKLKALGFQQAPVVVPESGEENAWAGFRLDQIKSAVAAQQADASPATTPSTAPTPETVPAEWQARFDDQEPLVSTKKDSAQQDSWAPKNTAPTASEDRVEQFAQHDAGEHGVLTARRLEVKDLEKNNAQLDNAVLDGSTFTHCSFENSSFANSSLRFATFSWTQLLGANFTGADCTGADFSTAQMGGDLPRFGGIVVEGANFTGANASRTFITEQGLGETNMTDAILVKAHLERVLLPLEMSGAMLVGAEITESEGEYINLSDASAQRMYLEDTTITEGNFSRANFSGASASGSTLDGNAPNAVFTGSEFSTSRLNLDMLNADFAGSSITNCQVGMSATDSNFQAVDFSKSNLSESQFSSCNFSGAQFNDVRFEAGALKDCDLTGADFSNATLQGVDFTGSNISGATFSNAYIVDCEGLPAGLASMSTYNDVFAFSVSDQLNATKSSPGWTPDSPDSPAPGAENDSGIDVS